MHGRLVCVEVHSLKKRPFLVQRCTLQSGLPGYAGLAGIFTSNALGYSDLPWGTILSHYGSNSSASQRNMLSSRSNLWHRARWSITSNFWENATNTDLNLFFSKLFSSAPNGIFHGFS
eukprot:s1165_g3.t1